MNILFIGDIVGRPGREILTRVLPQLKKDHAIDFVVANAENSSGGGGIIPKSYDEIMAAGCDVLTMGDHTWDKPEINTLWEKTERLVRPANFAPETPGRGWTIVRANNGIEVMVINLLGRTFMKYHVDCPFRALDNILNAHAGSVKIKLVDMHAETTSEKNAFGLFADGKVSSVVGTHTHVQTADERVLANGTAYITDLGMTGPHDSVIGQDKERIIARFWTGLPQKFNVAVNDPKVNGVVINIDELTGRAQSIKRISQGL